MLHQNEDPPLVQRSPNMISRDRFRAKVLGRRIASLKDQTNTAIASERLVVADGDPASMLPGMIGFDIHRRARVAPNIFEMIVRNG